MQFSLCRMKVEQDCQFGMRGGETKAGERLVH